MALLLAIKKAGRAGLRLHDLYQKANNQRRRLLRAAGVVFADKRPKKGKTKGKKARRKLFT